MSLLSVTLAQHSSASENKDMQNPQLGVGNLTRRNLVTARVYKPTKSYRSPWMVRSITELGENERGKLKINLLHVVPRRSLHVAFRSSRTLPENRNPTATRYDSLHTWQNGRVSEQGRETERENDGGIAFSVHDAMTSEI